MKEEGEKERHVICEEGEWKSDLHGRNFKEASIALMFLFESKYP